MAGDQPPASGHLVRCFHRPCWGWVAAGATGFLGAAFLTGTPVSEAARRLLGQGAIAGVFFALVAGGGLCLVIAAVTYLEYVAIDDVAIEQLRLGAPRQRMLWEEVDRITLHKGRRRPRGPIELRARGRTMLLDASLVGFGDLELAIRAKAAEYSVDLRDWRR